MEGVGRTYATNVVEQLKNMDCKSNLFKVTGT